jgi:hypothetical protein
MLPVVGNVFVAQINVSGSGYVNFTMQLNYVFLVKSFLLSFMTSIFRPQIKLQRSA